MYLVGIELTTQKQSEAIIRRSMRHKELPKFMKGGNECIDI